MSIDIKTNTDGTAKGNFSEVVTPIIAPASDSITAIQITKADGTTVVLDIDTVNKRLGVNNTSPTKSLDVVGDVKASSSLITPLIVPVSDSITAIQITKADGTTVVLDIDTINKRVGINKTPGVELDVNGAITASGAITGILTGTGDLNINANSIRNLASIYGSATLSRLAMNTTAGSGSFVGVDGNHVLYPVQKVTASEPSYMLGGKYFNTTLNKDMIGGASVFEVIQSQPKTPTTLTPGATVSLDPTVNSTFTLSPGGNETINAASVATYGQIISIIFTSRAVADVITLGTNFKSTGTLTMAGVAGKIHTMMFVSDGTNYNELSRTAGM